MDDLLLLSDARMRRIEPHFPLFAWDCACGWSACAERLLFVIRKGLRWRDARAAYRPPKQDGL